MGYVWRGQVRGFCRGRGVCTCQRLEKVRRFFTFPPGITEEFMETYLQAETVVRWDDLFFRPTIQTTKSALQYAYVSAF